ncbi:facilitated trehalose transporter Tret1-like isoform X1 [Prorops nasuta]|uniref:facilitated trehalose transporter Tret1-like isoform X1 n=1 Tax=Prorops nasuta TaxID=863751 RepID=UPI0034CE2C9A
MWDSAKRGVFAQIIASTIVNTVLFMGGVSIGWGAPMIPRMTQPGNEPYLTSSQVSWVVGFMGVGNVAGALMGGLFTDYLGRKRAQWFSLFPIILAYVLNIFVFDYGWLLFTRFLCGFSIAWSISVIPMYIGEIVEPRIRGLTNIISMSCMHLGTIYAYVLGPILNIDIFSIACAVPGICFAPLFFLIPETPHQLLMQGDTEEARKSLTWLRGGADVTDEMEGLVKYIEQRKRNKKGIKELLVKEGNRKGLIICLLLVLGLQANGSIVIQNYITAIFNYAGLNYSSNYSSIIIGITYYISSILSMFIIDRIGRRTLLAVGSFIISIFLAMIAVFFHLRDIGYDVDNYLWVPIVGLFGYAIAVNVGVAGIPLIIRAEVFPPNVKAPANMVLVMWAGIVGSGIIKLFQVVDDNYGMYTIFYFFCVANMLLNVLVAVYMPETKGKTFEEIEIILEKRKSISKSNLVED